MVHKSSILPGVSKFIDESVLSHYPPTSMKRIVMAGAVSLYMKKNEGVIDTIVNNPLFTSLGVVTSDGMIDLESLRDSVKEEINKVGFMRLSLPMIGDIDFTTEDIDMLFKYITEANTSKYPNVVSQRLGTTPITNRTNEVY